MNPWGPIDIIDKRIAGRRTTYPIAIKYVETLPIEIRYYEN